MPRKLCGRKDRLMHGHGGRGMPSKGRCSAGPRVSYEHTENADSEFPKEDRGKMARKICAGFHGALQVQPVPSRRFKYLL